MKPYTARFIFKKIKLQTLILSLLLLATAACRSPAVETEQGETLVILGFPAGADGSPSPLMKLRLDKALGIYDKTKTKAVITTGGAVYNSLAEAEVMRDYLIKNGIPERKIITETRAHSTFGNAFYSAKIIRDRKLPTPVIVTSKEHEARARWTFSLFLRDFRMAQ